MATAHDRCTSDSAEQGGEHDVSLTEAEHVFAGPHESGVNDLFRAVFLTRPRLLRYASFAPTSAVVTNIPAISFPGVGSIHFAVIFDIPVVDFHPDSSGGMPPPLALGIGEFSVRTTVTLILLCRGDRKRDEGATTHLPPASTAPVVAKLDVWGVGSPTVTTFGPSSGEMTFRLRAVELVDITPDDLESLLECLIRMLLDAVLQQVRLPFNALDAGFFSLNLLRGPEVEDDQAKLYGDIV